MAMPLLKRLLKKCPLPPSGRNGKRVPRRSPRLTVEALEAREVPAVFNVTTTADVLGGPALSLRQAILNANHTLGLNVINLTVPGTYRLTRFGNSHDGTNGALQLTDPRVTIN